MAETYDAENKKRVSLCIRGMPADESLYTGVHTGDWISVRNLLIFNDETFKTEMVLELPIERLLGHAGKYL
jgi:hypothetical protein